jgi:hypothetical protein
MWGMDSKTKIVLVVVILLWFSALAISMTYMHNKGWHGCFTTTGYTFCPPND